MKWQRTHEEDFLSRRSGKRPVPRRMTIICARDWAKVPRLNQFWADKLDKAVRFRKILGLHRLWNLRLLEVRLVLAYWSQAKERKLWHSNRVSARQISYLTFLFTLVQRQDLRQKSFHSRRERQTLAHRKLRLVSLLNRIKNELPAQSNRLYPKTDTSHTNTYCLPWSLFRDTLQSPSHYRQHC